MRALSRLGALAGAVYLGASAACLRVARRWLDAGASWPRADGPGVGLRATDTIAGRAGAGR